MEAARREGKVETTKAVSPFLEERKGSCADVPVFSCNSSIPNWVQVVAAAYVHDSSVGFLSNARNHMSINSTTQAK